MEEKLWLICFKKFCRSFRAYMESHLLNNYFKYTNINATVNRWISEEFIKIIIPDIKQKLDSNSIFRLGLIVRDMVNNIVEIADDELHQKMVPLKIQRNESIDFF